MSDFPGPVGPPEPSGHPDRSGHCGYYGHSERDVQREVTELESTTAARLFDIRRIMGGLFVVYGVIVTLAGLTASDADIDIDKAEGVNINLWTGLGMLALGVFFPAWLWLRPIRPAREGPD